MSKAKRIAQRNRRAAFIFDDPSREHIADLIEAMPVPVPKDATPEQEQFVVLGHRAARVAAASLVRNPQIEPKVVIE